MEDGFFNSAILAQMFIPFVKDKTRDLQLKSIDLNKLCNQS